MEILIRLVGTDDHVYPNHMDVMQWLADSNLLEMVVDKLSPSNFLEVHANAAETLCTIAQNAPSPLATKLSSSRGQQIFESPISVNPETIATMVPILGDFVKLLNATSDEKVLPITYGQLRPPLGSHRLKIVEFIAILLKTQSVATGKELASSGAIRRVLDLFFEYPYNNALHHQVESTIVSCLESKNDEIVDHLLHVCDLIGKILKIEKQPILSGENQQILYSFIGYIDSAFMQPTIPVAGKQAPRVGNIGHISRISNKLVQLSTNNNLIKTSLEEHNEWGEWEANTLHDRNAVENVYRWVCEYAVSSHILGLQSQLSSCKRPTALHDRSKDSDDDEVHDRDYDLAGLANNLNHFRYNMQENNGAGEDHCSNDRDEEDVYLDDESTEVVISSLKLGEEQNNNLFTNSNWFTFQGDELGDNTGTGAIRSEEAMEDVSLNETSGNGIENDEEDCLITEGKNPFVATASTSDAVSVDTVPGDIEFDEDVVSGESSPEMVERGDSSSSAAEVTDPFPADDMKIPDVRVPNGSSSSEGEVSPKSPPVPSFFGKDVEYVGVEPEGTERAMDQALLKEGIVGEAGPMKRNSATDSPGKESTDENIQQEYNDTNYWKVDPEVAVVE
ncbi:hypothetical protein Bca4012_089314 [Brassica carinata]